MTSRCEKIKLVGKKGREEGEHVTWVGEDRGGGCDQYSSRAVFGVWAFN